MATPDECLSDSSSSTIKGPIVRNGKSRQKDIDHLRSINPLRKTGSAQQPSHSTRLGNASAGDKDSSTFDIKHSHKQNTELQPVAQQTENSVKDDERNDSDTSISSAETVKATDDKLRGKLWHALTPDSRQGRCTTQLLRWAHENRSANLTLAEILERANWEDLRLERLQVWENHSAISHENVEAIAYWMGTR